jgi:hypothetical protein
MSSNDISCQPPAPSSESDGQRKAAKAKKELYTNLLNQLIESTENDILKQIKGYDTVFFLLICFKKSATSLGLSHISL